jgi:hypothetical protein
MAAEAEPLPPPALSALRKLTPNQAATNSAIQNRSLRPPPLSRRCRPRTATSAMPATVSGLRGQTVSASRGPRWTAPWLRTGFWMGVLSRRGHRSRVRRRNPPVPTVATLLSVVKKKRGRECRLVFEPARQAAGPAQFG